MNRALLIEFDPRTGKRAGGIGNKDPKLVCYGWQDLDSIPAREVRLVMDDRDLSQYEGKAGITVLNGEAEIQAAIDSIATDHYKITNETLLTEHIRQRGISLDDYAGWDEKDVLKDLLSKGLVGIRKREPTKVRDVIKNK